MHHGKSVVRSWIESPQILRRLIRESQPWQILCCIGLGIVVGVMITLLHELVQWLHRAAFVLPEDTRLSAASAINPRSLVLVPVLGGLLLGLNVWLMRRWRSAEMVDPIEANATLGGRMSMRDNLRLLWLALLSNGAGSSIGMEAAYTQMGAGILSTAGQMLQLRREDLRVFVAAGAAAAIAGAFNAPLAGAFYAFELVLGSYTIAALPSVALCALASALVTRVLTSGEPVFHLSDTIVDIPDWHYPVFLLMGVVGAFIGIATMRITTFCENRAARAKLAEWLRPAIGGAFLALLATLYPQVLGSGQGAIGLHLQQEWPLYTLLFLLLLKMLASAISIGSGFRGGLFSSSLFIGCLFGQCVGIFIDTFSALTQEQMECFILVGMGAVATSIIGAPIAIVLLILEMTGSFPATTGVMVGGLVASAMTRQLFGYSFSTWRFHLRGVRISSGADIGWIHELTVQRFMRTDPKTVQADTPLPQLRELAPAGTTRRLFVLDEGGFYIGMLDVPALHSHSLDKKTEMTARNLAHSGESFLLPGYHIQQALAAFKQAEQEVLPVLAGIDSHVLVGYVSEAYALRRYADALELHNMQSSLAGSPIAAETRT